MSQPKNLDEARRMIPTGKGAPPTYVSLPIPAEETGHVEGEPYKVRRENARRVLPRQRYATGSTLGDGDPFDW